MANHEIQVKQADSILEDLNRLHEAVTRRAYDLFRGHEASFPGDLADWFDAERELIWRPAIELRQKDGEFELKASVAGLSPQEVELRVTAEDILIKGKTEHKHEAQAGTVHVCEFQSGQLFRSVHLPERIDPDSVTAEQRNGVLRVTAKIVKTEARRVDAQAA